MGVYVYTLRKKSIPVKLEDGSVVTAVCLAYAYKDTWAFGTGRYAAKRARMDSFGEMARDYWNSREVIPTHVVLYDPDCKESRYASIYKVDKLRAKDYSTPCFKGEYLGHVHREYKGRKVFYSLIPRIK